MMDLAFFSNFTPLIFRLITRFFIHPAMMFLTGQISNRETIDAIPAGDISKVYSAVFFPFK